MTDLPPPRRILRNSVKCKHCGDEIESKHRHDFVYCRCGKVAVDGGRAYLKRAGDLKGYTETSLFEGDAHD